jgi:peptidyl-dipeptidase A
MKNVSYLISLTVIVFLVISCGDTVQYKGEKALNQIIDNYESKMIPLQKELNESTFKASQSGKEEDYKKVANLEITIGKILSNRETFQTLKNLKDKNLITDTLLNRQLDILYSQYIKHQVDEDMQTKLIMLDNKISEQFSSFRAKIDEKEYSDIEIEHILATSLDNEELKNAWQASKEIGSQVAKNIILVVKKRNELAKSLAYANYYDMQLKIKGLDPQKIQSIFDELDILTRGPYTQLKSEMDVYLAKHYKIPVENLMPWNYQNRFFQQAPQIYDLDLNKFYESNDLLSKANEFYNGIGLPIEDLLGKSDLFTRPGKSQLGYTVDIDREGDVRILLNIDKSFYSMSSLLYECGFAAYYKNIDRSIPYILRQAPQFFVIDAVATFLSSFASNPVWMKTELQLSDAEYSKIKVNAAKQLRLDKFVFSRWAQVMYRFEKALYENPEQDLNKLWWDLVENYQMINRPVMRDNPDWAAKTHIATQPCTYYNYMLGELAAAQIQVFINSELLKSGDDCMIDCVNNPKVGQFLKDKIFSKGAVMNWNDLMKEATGDELSADYFAKLYIH